MRIALIPTTYSDSTLGDEFYLAVDDGTTPGKIKVEHLKLLFLPANLDASRVTVGTFDIARIPSLPASQITSGAFAVDRIPSLDAAKITTGEFAAERIPGLDASKIEFGTISPLRLPVLPGNNTLFAPTIAELSEIQQTVIQAGTSVITDDGRRWRYMGEGSVLLEANYSVISDVSPLWGEIVDKPDFGNAITMNVPAVAGAAASATELVRGDDSRLSGGGGGGSGVGIESITQPTADTILVTLTDASTEGPFTLPAGPAGADSFVEGPIGPSGADSTVPGPPGDTGLGIAAISQPTADTILVTLTDSSEQGPFTLPAGPAGADSTVAGPAGVGIASVTQPTSDSILVNLTDSSTQGPFTLPAGPAGADSTVAGPAGNDGIGISSITQPTSDTILVNLTDATTQGPFTLPAGPEGAASMVPGPTGATGEGATWLYGSDAPGGLISANVTGDMYLRDNGAVYHAGAPGTGSWAFVLNILGAAGDDGNTILNGTAVPVLLDGVDGDYYIRTTTNTIYGPKTGGAWGSGVSLVGPTGATGPAGSPAKFAQVVTAVTTAAQTTTVLIPDDDTIPQNTEGAEYLTCSITPTNAASTLLIEVVAQFAHSALAYRTVALFKDSGANALAATVVTGAANYIVPVVFTHSQSAGSTSAQTFRLRFGGSVAGTSYLNGNSSGRRFGGVCPSSIVITEILP